MEKSVRVLKAELNACLCCVQAGKKTAYVDRKPFLSELQEGLTMSTIKSKIPLSEQVIQQRRKERY